MALRSPGDCAAIAPEVGPFLVMLALAVRARTIVEIGTSAGYSTLWLAVAAAQTGGRIITFEIDPAKIEQARTTFVTADVEGLVDLRPRGRSRWPRRARRER